MRFPTFLAAALIVAAGAAQAQSPSYPSSTPTPNTQMPNAQAPGAQMPGTQMPNSQMNTQMPNQAESGGAMGGCGHTPTITDEYGFRYDSSGNRLNGSGCVIAPPVSPPGTKG